MLVGQFAEQAKRSRGWHVPGHVFYAAELVAGTGFAEPVADARDSPGTSATLPGRSPCLKLFQQAGQDTLVLPNPLSYLKL